MIRKVFRIALSFILIMALFGVTGYAARVKLMEESDRQLTPQPDQALIVFMRSSFVGSAISASIFDVTDKETKFVGIMYNATKVCYDVAPGEYIFMVIGESADFMKATVEAGKTYYALITPRPGAWKARFSFKPLRRSDLESADFAKWDSKTKLVKNTSDSEAWAGENAEDIEEKRAEVWPEWCELPFEEQDEMTLKLEDGR
jgi:hypothetical protein